MPTPVERIAELVEAIFAKEQALVTELLTELGRCGVADLRTLFGPWTPADTPATNGPPAPGSDVETLERRPSGRRAHKPPAANHAVLRPVP
jgi:hypothetical protein